MFSEIVLMKVKERNWVKIYELVKQISVFIRGGHERMKVTRVVDLPALDQTVGKRG